LPTPDYHRVLGLAPGATKKQIKTAYRKLALKYHPDRNKSAGAARKFQEITEAYDFLLEHPGYGTESAPTYEDRVASEILRRERERMQQRARAQRAKKKAQDDYFQRPEWHDPILLLKYLANGFILLLGIAAIIVPILMAIFVDPASLAGMAVFMLMGSVALVYIYQKRKTWFKLGRFNTSLKDLYDYFRLKPGKTSKDTCCYYRKVKADGNAFKIELIKTIDIKIQSYGALNHDAKYKIKTKRVVVPRSARAQFFHRMVSLVKLFSILVCMVFFSLDSILWRFIAGIIAGGALSSLILIVARVRSRNSYLFTPGLLLKAIVWLSCLALISEPGPGFNIQISQYVYLVVAGLLFFLDMLFDLLLGFFPFYRRMFRPLLQQGPVLDGLYKEGYQNYQELPVYSVIYPLFRWLF
jgi:hypothetical protein